ncbi:MAG: hypothetical protein ACR2PF_19395 [Rhizobiaceae bacterium]
MDHETYSLPNDAPSDLLELLERWKHVWKQHPPTQRDFLFDELVVEYPGLFLVDPSPERDGDFDPIFVRAGPECKKRIRNDMEGLPYSRSINPRVFAQVKRIYPQIIETGEPHYWEITNAFFGVPPQQYYRLLLPIYDSGERVSRLLGICVWVGDKIE